MSEQTVWYKMGIRGDEFHGVDPGLFLNTGARFFLKLKHMCRKSVLPGYTPDAREANFSFAGTARYLEHLDWDDPVCRKKFLYQEPPMGVPLSRENWEAAAPRWDEDVLKPSLESILKEAPVSRKEVTPGFLHTGNLEWQKQLLKLIRAMNFCIVPLEIRYETSDGTWHEWFGNTGCVNVYYFRWDSFKRFHVKIPDMWLTPGVQYKIGIWAENHTPEYEVPVNGGLWKNEKEYTFVNSAPIYGTSEVRIYGAVDLKLHPDFREYFENETQQ